MKIKTITCHNVYNFGASLQAYALMTYLTSQGHQVEIIDYMPDYIRKNLSLWAIGPMAVKDAESWGVYAGNPAKYIKKRILKH